MTDLALAWRQGRSARAAAHGRNHKTVAVRLASLAGRYLPAWKRVRTTAMQVSAFGFLDFAAWRWSLIAGCIAIGLSLLVLEYLGGEK